MAKPSSTPKLLWQPTKEYIEDANLSHFISWLDENKSLNFTSYQELWQWSVDDINSFWQSILEYFEVIYEGTYSSVIDDKEMPKASWFSGIRLNYAEHIFRQQSQEYPALIFKTESSEILDSNRSSLIL